MKSAAFLLSLAFLGLVYQPADQPIKLVFVGDIMLSRTIGKIMAAKNDWTYPFLQIADVLRSADLTIGNLEGPISNKGTKLGSIYSFRADPRALVGLSFAGIDVLSLANNHIWDYGPKAFIDTLNLLRSADISYVGAGLNYNEAYRPTIKEVRGTRIAFLAYTNLVPPGITQAAPQPTVAFLNLKQIISDVRRAKALADLVIVSFHWGNEYETKHNQNQEALAHAVIDAGADLVIGHHPHVAQEIEEYHGGYIAYSLGNFVFDQNFSSDTKSGLLLKVSLRNKKIEKLEPQKIKFTKSFQPVY